MSNNFKQFQTIKKVLIWALFSYFLRKYLHMCVFFCNFARKIAYARNKTMNNTEIERKFLVRSDAFKAQATTVYTIMQGYLCKEPGKTIRVRIREDRAFLTIKSGKLRDGLAKFEWEKEIDVSDARELMQLCLPGVIEKERYIIPCQAVSCQHSAFSERFWEVDVFHGRLEGRVLAEIELGSEDEAFERPEWLGEEVTGLPQYYNANM